VAKLLRAFQLRTALIRNFKRKRPRFLEKKTVRNGTLFILEKPFESRSKWLFTFYSIAFFALLSWYFGEIFAKVDLTSILLLATVVTAYLIAGYRFASKASRMETLLVTSNSVELIEKGWFHKKKKKFDIKKISNLRFVEKPVLSPHPLAGLTFDYLGFQTTQQVINEMYGDNRIAFDYNGATISFGKNLYSWDYEDLFLTIYPITNYN
jgi:hypothetical protein